MHGIVRTGGSLLLVLAALSCSMPTTGPGPTDSASVATVVDLDSGAVLGAAPESLRRQRRHQQLILDGHHVLARDEISDYLNRQAAMLDSPLSDTPVRMRQTNKTLRIIMPADSVFSSGNTVRPGYRQLLTDIADSMSGFERHLVEIAGHAAAAGETSADQRLSETRARAVGQILAEQGIAEARLLIVGYGRDRPSGEPDTPVNRIELVLVPIVSTD